MRGAEDAALVLCLSSMSFCSFQTAAVVKGPLLYGWNFVGWTCWMSSSNRLAWEVPTLNPHLQWLSSVGEVSGGMRGRILLRFSILSDGRWIVSFAWRVISFVGVVAVCLNRGGAECLRYRLV